MSETNSLNSPELTADHTPTANAAPFPAIDAAGSALSERLGVGGMGEVYRFADQALQRDLAIKILKESLRGNADAEERFLREARLTGSLQHPGIVPVHQLGRFADGRPYYTMKLVRGRTFADMIRDEPQTPERLPRLLAIVEKVCQAVAYAHSKGVIHRDLKPSNVMVGEFGEVQVVDWGLAKELSRDEPAASVEATMDVETVARAEEGEGLSRAGSALGTPEYMPPEQAAGDWDIVDERADVFALGAILCAVLTGAPPYYGGKREDLLRRARRGDLAEALGRLDKCGADAVLVDLCRECLAAERLQRPRHAGAVAERLASYQAEVRERLRQAELQRARAEVKALEERKRRRLIAALALSALVMLAGGVTAWWQWQKRRAEADDAVKVALSEARLLHQQAQADPLSAAAYDRAMAAARKAEDIAHAGGASTAVQGQASELLAELQQEAEEAAKDRRLLAALLEVHGPREGPKYSRDDKGKMMTMAAPTKEEQFASAFRDWGLDVDATPTAEAVVRLKARPAAVVTEVIAALDERASQLRQDQKREAAQRLADLAAVLDDAPDSLRRELREILSRGRLPVERSLGILSAALRPVPLAVEVPLGKDRRRLRRLTEKIDPASEPVLGLLTLTQALRMAGDDALAERLLRAALTARPQEVVLYHKLGQLLTEQEPPRWAEAVEFYRAARSLRPDLGVSLAKALLSSGRADEGLALLAQMVRESPDNPSLNFEQGFALYGQWKFAEAEKAYRKAIALKPDYAAACMNLGSLLLDQWKLAEAKDAYHKLAAIPGGFYIGMPYLEIGNYKVEEGDLVAAEGAYRKVLAINPDFDMAYYNLGIVLSGQKKYAEAEMAFRKAIALKPDYIEAYYNLGHTLYGQGKHVDAEAAYCKAIALKPDYAEAHCDLGVALQLQGRFTESLTARRRGHELGSKRSDWRFPSLQWVRETERMVALEKKLPAILKGEASPANTDDAITLAQMCQQTYQKRYAASARLYADAFPIDAKLAADLNQQHRYNAACSAALAAARQGEDARLLPDKVAAMFRRWALTWLRDDLTAYAKLAEQNESTTNKMIQQRMAHWRSDADLAAVRDPQALDRLHESDRAAWQALWRDVDQLAKRATKQDKAGENRDKGEDAKPPKTDSHK